MKRAQSKIQTVPPTSAEIIIMPQCVFVGDTNGSQFEIYRKKDGGKWAFKGVVEANDAYPFMYSRDAVNKEYLMEKDGWRKSFNDAIDDSPLDIWLNYVEIVIHHTYADRVRKKIVEELDLLHLHLTYMVEHCKKHRRTSCN